MTNLKNFIVQEAIDEHHAKRLLDYQEKFHSEAAIELAERLANAWTVLVKTLSARQKPDPEAAQELTFRNPDKACVGLDLITTPRKNTSSRYRHAKEVSPSVKISLAFSEAQRKLIRDALLKRAVEVMKKLTDDWQVAFKSEMPNGKITTLFKIIHHGDEVRLSFDSEENGTGTHRTVFVVSTEFGKAGTKLRDHDLVYLVDLL